VVPLKSVELQTALVFNDCRDKVQAIKYGAEGKWMGSAVEVFRLANCRRTGQGTEDPFADGYFLSIDQL